MTRSLKVTLKFANTNKQTQLDGLWVIYRQAVQNFLNRLYTQQDISESYLKDYNTMLSYRYKQCAKRQALSIFNAWSHRKKKKNKPTLRTPSMTLDCRFIDVQRSSNSAFDYWVKIATLVKGHPILLPFKSYGYLNQYFNDWQLVRGGKLTKHNNQWFLTLTFKQETPEIKQEGKTVGLDIGYRKLAVTSEGQIIGQNLKELINKADQKEQGSNGYYRSKSEIKNYINRELKGVFTDDLQCLVVEDLKGLKKNKRGQWSRTVNRRFNFWLYGYSLNRLNQLSENYGVHNPSVVAKYTSQSCSICGYIDKLNRNGEYFKCLQCGHQSDADFNASINIRNRFTHQHIVGVIPKPFL